MTHDVNVDVCDNVLHSSIRSSTEYDPPVLSTSNPPQGVASVPLSVGSHPLAGPFSPNKPSMPTGSRAEDGSPAAPAHRQTGAHVTGCSRADEIGFSLVAGSPALMLPKASSGKADALTATRCLRSNVWAVSVCMLMTMRLEGPSTCAAIRPAVGVSPAPAASEAVASPSIDTGTPVKDTAQAEPVTADVPASPGGSPDGVPPMTPPPAAAPETAPGAAAVQTDSASAASPSTGRVSNAPDTARNSSATPASNGAKSVVEAAPGPGSGDHALGGISRKSG